MIKSSELQQLIEPIAGLKDGDHRMFSSPDHQMFHAFLIMTRVPSGSLPFTISTTPFLTTP